RGQSHQTIFIVIDATSCGVSLPFFCGCHWAAISGATVAREFLELTRRPEQNGHAVPVDALCLIVVDHSCSGPSGHFHHTVHFSDARTISGRSLPFLVGCHCAAISGATAASELVFDVLSPQQNGHW